MFSHNNRVEFTFNIKTTSHVYIYYPGRKVQVFMVTSCNIRCQWTTWNNLHISCVQIITNFHIIIDLDDNMRAQHENGGVILWILPRRRTPRSVWAGRHRARPVWWGPAASWRGGSPPHLSPPPEADAPAQLFTRKQ